MFTARHPEKEERSGETAGLGATSTAFPDRHLGKRETKKDGSFEVEVLRFKKDKGGQRKGGGRRAQRSKRKGGKFFRKSSG